MTPAEPRALTERESWIISCHEAGHAVAAVRFDMNVECVMRGEGEFGEMRGVHYPLDHPEYPWPLESVSQWQQCYSAGAAAELLLFGDEREYASARDRVLHARLETLRPDVRDNGWREDVQAVMKVLDHDSILKVARALHPQGRLDDEQLYGLFGLEPPWAREP